MMRRKVNKILTCLFHCTMVPNASAQICESSSTGANSNVDPRGYGEVGWGWGTHLGKSEEPLEAVQLQLPLQASG